MGVNIYSLRISETVPVTIQDWVVQLGLLSLKGKLTEFDLDEQRQNELNALAGLNGSGGLHFSEAVLLASPIDFQTV